jgi:hypothetical protein
MFALFELVCAMVGLVGVFFVSLAVIDFVYQLCSGAHPTGWAPSDVVWKWLGLIERKRS